MQVVSSTVCIDALVNDLVKIVRAFKSDHQLFIVRVNKEDHFLRLALYGFTKSYVEDLVGREVLAGRTNKCR